MLLIQTKKISYTVVLIVGLFVICECSDNSSTINDLKLSKNVLIQVNVSSNVNESIQNVVNNNMNDIISSNGSVHEGKNGSDVGKQVTGERIPIWEIVLRPNGRKRESESPSTSGRQLVDVAGRNEDRKPSTLPVKNGSMQRDYKDNIKDQNENETTDGTIFIENSADIEKVSSTIVTKMGVDQEDKFTESFIKASNEISADEAHFLPPLPLISDDCNEMKTVNSMKNLSNYRDRDMEHMEREKNGFKKASNTPENFVKGLLFANSKSISHVHRYDKSRRAIADYKTQFYNPIKKEDVQINPFAAADGGNVIQNVPFETEVNLKTISIEGFQNHLKPNQQPSKGNEFITSFTSTTTSKTLTSMDSSFDYFKRKTYNLTTKDSIEVLSNKIDPESNIVKPAERGYDLMESPGLNMSLQKNKDEKWTAWHERDRDTAIRFSVAMSSEKYITPTLRLSEGTFVFRFLSGFFTFLQPFDFPTELLRDVMCNTISVPQLILQSIRVEAGFIIVIITAFVIALVVPAYGLCCALLKLIGGISARDRDSGSPPPGMMNDRAGPCEKKICLFLMMILVVVSFFGATVMVVGNESAGSGASHVRDLLSAAMRDIPTFVQAAHQSMSHTLLHGADQTISAMEHDLNSVDVLLGEPIQSALSAETGVDVALDALSDIATASRNLAEKVLALGVCGSRAASLAATAKERLSDLKRQADMAKRHCGLRDRPLCETSDTHGIELVMEFEMVSEQQMDYLALVLRAENLTQAADTAREQFNDIPRVIANQTSEVIDEIKDALYRQRLRLQVAERSLAKVALHITTEITRATRHVEHIVRSIDAIEFWRWIVCLVALLVISFVLLLHIVAITCGCCGIENYAGALSQTSVITMCLFSIPLWFLTIAVFVAGGHGEVFVCRPLYNDPDYAVLGKLLDKPGLLYNNTSGFFEELFKDLNNISINVPIADILRECKENNPAYPVFRLRDILDVNIATAHYNWSALHGIAEKLSKVAPAPATYISAPKTHEELKVVMRAANLVNFTEYRLQLNGPLTGKDLNALADQFESIANQISDLTTSSRVETLASRTRRLSVNTIQPLEQLRNELVFRLTELEIQFEPFNKQMNQSLSHLKTIQFYIENQGAIIAEKKVQAYVSRLVSYLEQYRGHVLNQMENHIAPCRPLWHIYESGRSLACRHYVDSVNGYWFGLSCCLFTWTFAAPLCLRLRRACKAAKVRKEGLLLRTISHQSSSENAVISDQSGWGILGEQESDHWR